MNFRETWEYKLAAFRNATEDYQRKGLGEWLLANLAKAATNEKVIPDGSLKDFAQELHDWSDRGWSVEVPELDTPFDKGVPETFLADAVVEEEPEKSRVVIDMGEPLPDDPADLEGRQEDGPPAEGVSTT